jgi:hypothetical protein
MMFIQHVYNFAAINRTLFGLIHVNSLMSHREIDGDHGINVDQHSKPWNKGKYSIQ